MNSGVTELDEILEPLPRSVQLESGLEDIPWDVPPNGRDIRNLERKHPSLTPCCWSDCGDMNTDLSIRGFDDDASRGIQHTVPAGHVPGPEERVVLAVHRSEPGFDASGSGLSGGLVVLCASL